MSHPFHVYGAALGLVSALRPVLEQLAKLDRSLTDQLRRAASSVVLNLAEGNRRTGKDRVHFFRIAAGSAAEMRAALDVARAWGPRGFTPAIGSADSALFASRMVARAWGMISAAPAVEVELDRVLAMTWKLTHPRRP